MEYKVVIGLPAYNEEDALPKLFEKIMPLHITLGASLQVIVVNDGSIDNTEAVLKECCERYPYVRYLNHPKNLGLGRAIRTLMDHVVQNYEDDDVLITLDADNTHNPAIIIDMLKMLKNQKLDVVIASRFTPGGKEIGLSFIRKIYSRGAKTFFKIFFPIKNVNDYSCGFRAYNIGYLKKAMKCYKGELVTSSGFECMAEILARFSKVGVKAGEYPLVLEYNLKKGRTKMKVIKTIKGYFTLLGRVKKPDFSFKVKP